MAMSALCETEGSPAHVVNEFEQLLQFHVATYKDNDIAGQPQALQESGCPVKSIRARFLNKGILALTVGRKLAIYDGVVVRYQRYRVDVGIANEIAPPKMPPPPHQPQHQPSPEVGPSSAEEAPLAMYGVARRKDVVNEFKQLLQSLVAT